MYHYHGGQCNYIDSEVVSGLDFGGISRIYPVCDCNNIYGIYGMSLLNIGVGRSARMPLQIWRLCALLLSYVEVNLEGPSRHS